MNIVKCQLSRCISSIVLILIVAGAPIIACDWDYKIWSIHSKDADPLYRFIQNGKAGYIDRDGKIVIQAKFEFSGNSGGEFHDGLMSETGWEGPFYNTSGHIGLNKSYFRIWGFSDGLAVAMRSDGEKWGYINRAGDFVISPRFNWSKGSYVYSFANEFARIQVDDKFGYIDKSGNFAIKPTLIYSFDFENEMARVIVDGPCRFVTGPCPELETVPRSAKGEVPLCKFAFIDKTGSLISSEQFDDAGNFSEGLAPVRIGDKWGYIDKTGRHVIEPKFSGASSFSDGLAMARQGKLTGYINHSGDFVISPQFEKAEDFSDGRALTGSFDEQKREWTYHYVDQKGKTAFPGRYVQAGSFYKGLAHVMLEKAKEPKLVEQVWSGTYGYIDVKGKVVFRYEVK